MSPLIVNKTNFVRPSVGELFEPSWVADSTVNEISVTGFSADGRLFATVAKESPIAKVWYHFTPDQVGSLGIFQNMDYIVLSHSRAVIDLKWRLRAGVADASSVEAYNDDFKVSPCC